MSEVGVFAKGRDYKFGLSEPEVDKIDAWMNELLSDRRPAGASAFQPLTEASQAMTFLRSEPSCRH